MFIFSWAAWVVKRLKIVKERLSNLHGDNQSKNFNFRLFVVFADSLIFPSLLLISLFVIFAFNIT